MIAVIRSELAKLATTRSPWLVLAGVPFVAIIGVTGLSLQSAELEGPGMQSLAVAHLGLGAMFSLVFGAFAVAGEYRHRTITDTYLSTPRRSPVMAAKFVVYLVLGGIAGVVGAAAAFGAVAVWWSVKEVSFDAGDADMWSTLVGGAVANALYAAIGVGVGALIRNLTASIVALLAWLTLVEGIVGQLVGTDLAKWLPFTAGRALALDGAGGAVDLLTRPEGGLVVAGYAVVFALAAMFTTLKRDVT
jgi:ABC-2 type transport system permease protein